MHLEHHAIFEKYTSIIITNLIGISLFLGVVVANVFVCMGGGVQHAQKQSFERKKP